MQQPSLTSELISGPELKCKSGLVAVEVAKGDYCPAGMNLLITPAGCPTLF